MGIWIVMTLFAFVIPGLMLLFGKIFQVSPPDEINSVYGYRTRRSMASPEAWDFAHRRAGEVWSRLGLWTLVLTAAAMLLLLGKSAETVAWASLAVMVLQLVPLLAVFPLTERQLKDRFGENGAPVT